MSNAVLGIDTSNYTTSAAVLCGQDVKQAKMLLPVKTGERGIRQSDAVFHHVKQLPEVIAKAAAENKNFCAVGVSYRPRDAADSYMPCFCVGESCAQIISSLHNIPLYKFSHQSGHIAAALFSAGKTELFSKRFLAFHVSGGTTEAVLVEPDEKKIIKETPAAVSLDLKAGQAIDRCGVMLGLDFPCGAELEKLALLCSDEFKYRPSMKGADASFSGIENKYREMFLRNEQKERIAKFCLTAVLETLSAMCGELIKKYGDMPILFAGGVSSNVLIKDTLHKRFGAIFALPQFSCDNAVGAAVLCSESLKRGIKSL